MGKMNLTERADLASEVFSAVLEETETFEESHIGADLAYMMGAILGNYPYDAWKRSIPFLQILRRCFPAEHAVWGFVQDVDSCLDGLSEAES